jgi:hypothetical protein
MEIKIDTQKDSKEDIKKAIDFLKKVIEQEEAEVKENIKIFRDDFGEKKKLKKEKILAEDDEPEEKIKIVEY